MVHELKTDRDHFQDIWWNRKTFELRYDDRDYKVGDMLSLKEYNPESETFTGKVCTRVVSHVLHGPAYGLQEGWVIMSIKPL